MTEERYLRHSLIDWFSQETLLETKIAVVGAGAVGNEVIKNLSLLGVGEIHVFDFDTIEKHNLTRSVLFREDDVGSSKAEVAARRATELDPAVKIIPIVGDFWDNLTLQELQTFDILFCCVDNFEARIRCNTLCFLSKVDLVNVGIDSRYAGVEIYPFSHSVSDGCFECNLPSSVYSRMAQRFSCGHLRKVSFIERKIPTTIVTSSVSAGLAVSIGLRLGNNSDAREPTRYFIDTIAGCLTRTVLGRNDGCPCCGALSDVSAIFSTRSEIASIPDGLQDDATVTASDPILVGFRVRPDAEYTIVFKRASDFDSDFPKSLSETPDEVQVDIRDQFTLGELRTNFCGYNMPCKYVTISDGLSQVVWEFDGGKK